MDDNLEHTDPENRGVCGFCGKTEGGYAKQDANGKWKAACWPCVRPAQLSAPQPRRQVGSAPEMAPAEPVSDLSKKKRPLVDVEVITLYKTGRKTSAIAEAFGYAPDDDGKVLRILKKAGVYKKYLQ